ncbi:hypothetical protein ACYULU_04580 [Breznakiellaceae bacterium SP9]
MQQPQAPSFDNGCFGGVHKSLKNEVKYLVRLLILGHSLSFVYLSYQE